MLIQVNVSHTKNDVLSRIGFGLNLLGLKG